MKNCRDCDAEPGQYHGSGCDVERCPNCGGQFISCGCPDEETDGLARLKWTGNWPGKLECEEFGWWCKRNPHGNGYISCPKDDPEASHDLNRLYTDAKWDKRRGRFVLKTHFTEIIAGGRLCAVIAKKSATVENRRIVLAIFKRDENGTPEEYVIWTVDQYGENPSSGQYIKDLTRAVQTYTERTL